jgi:transcriptional regulator with XRE-family HTH domain
MQKRKPKQNQVSPIGLRIKQLRKQQKLTQRDLVEKSGVSYSTLTKIESGFVQNPTIEQVRKLAQALNVSLDTIADNL